MCIIHEWEEVKRGYGGWSYPTYYVDLVCRRCGKTKIEIISGFTPKRKKEKYDRNK
jgi:hypothetical protein